MEAERELSLKKIIRELKYYELKGTGPYYTAITSSDVSISLTRTKFGFKSVATVAGFNSDLGFSEDKKLAVIYSLGNIVKNLKYSQGGPYIMTTTKLADKVVKQCPPKLKHTITMPEKNYFALSAPSLSDRLSSIRMVQEEFRTLLPECVSDIVDSYSYTYDCDNYPNRDERIIDGVLVNSLRDTSSTIDEKELMDLNKFYMLNYAPRTKTGKLLVKVIRRPTDADLITVRMNNGSCAPLLYYDDVRFHGKYAKMDRIIGSTQHVVGLGKEAPILASRVFLKAEVEQHVKEDGTYKKIRAIQNSAPEAVILFSYLFDSYMQVTSGPFFGNFMGVSTAHSPMHDLIFMWFIRLKYIWDKRGITNFNSFLDYIDSSGSDCSDQKSWEATTERITALHAIFRYVSSLEPNSYKENSEWIDNLLANYVQPHSVLRQRGLQADVISKLGATESGAKPTLHGNSLRHSCMADLFYIKARRCYKSKNLILDGFKLPDIEDWEDELEIFLKCRQHMGDDSFALRTRFSALFHQWKDRKFGTVTKLRLTDKFFCKYNEYGIADDCAEFLQFNFTRRTGNKILCERSLPRILSKLLHKPFKEESHALAATQMAMFNVCEEGYDWLKQLYDQFLSKFKKNELLAKELEDFWKSDVEYRMYDKPMLIPPPPVLCEMYKLPNSTERKILERILHFEQYRQDLKNNERARTLKMD